MRSLAITQENLDNRRQAVQEERRLRLDNQPYGKSQERFNELAYDNFAYRHSVIGSMEDLNAATVDDVAGFFRTYYAPNNAVVAIVGDVDTKATLAKIEQYFGSIARQPEPARVDLSEREMTGERRDTVQDPLARIARLNLGYRIPPAAHADWPALSAAGQILGAGESSRLYQRLVKDQELCSGIGSGAGARVGPGLFTVTCSVRPGKSIADAEAAIDEEVNRLRTAAVTPDELLRVRISSRRGAVNLRESTIGRAQTLADNAVLYNDPNRINTNPEKISSVTAADVQRVVSTYLKNSNRVVVHTLPGGGPAAPTTTR
jgi:predicted Zn-dependent peptidase